MEIMDFTDVDENYHGYVNFTKDGQRFMESLDKEYEKFSIDDF